MIPTALAPCPVCGEPVQECEIRFGYVPCPRCGIDTKAPDLDVATMTPCGHRITGQDAISTWEHP